MEFDLLIVVLPLAAFLIIGIGSLSGRWMDKNAHFVAIPAVLGSFIFSAIGYIQVLESGPRTLTLYTWGVSGAFQATLDIRMDALTTAMLLLVTVVSSAVHVYTVGYMHGDRGYARFFAYLGLFTFSMIMLVVARNLLQLYVFWEAVGLCSYLLIAHYYEKPSAVKAANKAFIVNRVGDFGFALGIFLIFYLVGSIDYDVIFERLPGKVGEVFSILGMEFQAVTVISLLLFMGAVGKSAQFPLHVWLPDAMEGPTPISALIHAATMVTAGVFMVARLNPIFGLSPTALGVIAVVGAGTAIFAATIAVTQTDIKRVVAYSTVSQLGYMLMACGLGATVAGVFHLLTHGAFKALLFLCCGSIIHALSGEQDLRRMGGLKDHLPVTYKTFYIGALALSGIPPLAGFVSKDEILFRAFTSGGAGIFFWFIGTATAFLTAFYSFRLVYTIFHGESRVDPKLLSGKGEHGGIHESPASMTLPLILLAFLSVTVGWIGLPIHGWNGVEAVLAPQFPLDPHPTGSTGLQIMLMLISVAVAFGGWMTARYFYLIRPELPGQLAEKAGGFYRGSLNKWYVDEFYNRVIVRPMLRAADVMWRLIDIRIVDAAVNGVGKTAQSWARSLRLTQTGQLQHYALVMVAGTFAILTVYLVFF